MSETSYEYRFLIKERDSGKVVEKHIKCDNLQNTLDYLMDKLKANSVSFSQAYYIVVLELLQISDLEQ